MSMGEVGSTVMAAVDEFVQQLRRRQIEGSTATAKRTAEILRLLVTKSRRPTPEGMLEDVHFVGMRMQAAKPLGALSPQCRRPSAGKLPEHITCFYYLSICILMSSNGMRAISTLSCALGAASHAPILLRLAAAICAWLPAPLRVPRPT